MTNPDYTAVALLVDRSGSMRPLASDATGGIRQMLEDQRALPGRCTVRLCQFDDRYEIVYPSTDVHDAPDYELVPRGSTALLDSWGKAMVELGEELAAMDEDDRPARVVFGVVTDGHENASREWTREQVMEAVRRQTDEYGWEFLYLAANQDAVAEGAKYGVRADHTHTYAATGAGAQSAHSHFSGAVTRTRQGGSAAFEDAP